MDVFAVLPVSDNGGTTGAGRGHGGDWRPETRATSTEGYRPSPVSLKQYTMADADPSPQELAYRSVRRAPIRAKSASPKDGEHWEAAKAVMG